MDACRANLQRFVFGLGVLNMLDALIGAGASLLGGILGNNTQKKINNDNIAASAEAAQAAYGYNRELQNLAFEQNKDLYDYSKPDFQDIRDRANEAGFNPLSVLGLGQGQLGNMSGASHSPVAPQLSSRNFIGEALQKGVEFAYNAYTDNRDYEAQVAERNSRVKREQALDAAFRTPVGTKGYDLSAVPAYSPRGQIAKGGFDPDQAMSDQGTAPATKDMSAYGQKIRPSGLFSDAESGETRYGDIASNILGVPALLADVGYTIGRRKTGPDMKIGGKTYAWSANSADSVVYSPPAFFDPHAKGFGVAQ